MTMNAVAAASATVLVAKGFTDVTANAVTTGVDFDVLTISIPAGTLAATNALRWRLWCTCVGSSGTCNWRPKLKLGSTTIFSDTDNVVTASATTGWMNIEILIGFPTISTQRASMIISATGVSSSILQASGNWLSQDTASEDYSGTKNIVLVQNASFAAGTASCTVVGYTLELLT